MFVVTLDAVAVNVALPSIRADLGGGLSGLQWVVDGYTLLFAALLLSSGAVSDRLGARGAFRVGMIGFVASSAVCGLAPNLAVLIAARFVQGAAAALLTPSSMALLRLSFPDPRERARAVGVWAMGGAVASSSGPVLGGLLTAVDWRLIFFLNVPVGAVAWTLLTGSARSPRQSTPLDWLGQVLAVLAIAGITFGAIEAGVRGLADPIVVGALTLGVVGSLAFVLSQARVPHPMLPLALFRSATVRAVVTVGFVFMVCFYGLPFVMSLYLQQVRGLSPLATGTAFLPMMLIGAALTLFSARAVERFGSRRIIAAGLLVMAGGLIGVAVVPDSTPIWVLSALMMLVGLGGPAVMPPATAALLSAVPVAQSGTASGVLNTSRQVGGALAVAVFGALLAAPGTFVSGVRTSVLIAAGLAVAAALVATRLLSHRHEANS
jgi:MFS transporter, DHA2 family, methylenomycin A resistance protein